MSTRDAAALLLNSDLVKAGGPYIGPKGGKWADAKHTIPWKEPEPAGGGFSLHAAPVQQGLFGGSAYEAKPKTKPKKPDPEAHRQTDLFGAPAASAPAKPAFAPPPARTAMDQHAEEASAKAHAITASGDHVNGAIEHRVAAWTNRENGNDYKAREHERAAEALEKYGDLKRTAESWSRTAEKHEAEGAGDKFAGRGAFGATQSHAQAIEAHTKAEAAAKAAGLHSAAAEHRAAIEKHAPAEERIVAAARAGAEERKRKNAYADAAAAARHWTNVASASPTGSSHAVAAAAHHKAADQARASMEDSADRRRIEDDHRRAAQGHAEAAAKYGNPAAGKPYSDTPSERPKPGGDEARDRVKALAEKAKADTSYATAKKEADNASSAFDAGRGTPRTKREMMASAQDAHTAHMKAAKAARNEGKHAEAEQHESKARAFLPDDIGKARKMMAGGYSGAGGKKAKKPAPTHAAKTAEAMEAKESFDDAAAAAAEKIPTRVDADKPKVRTLADAISDNDKRGAAKAAKAHGMAADSKTAAAEYATSHAQTARATADRQARDGVPVKWDPHAAHKEAAEAHADARAAHETAGQHAKAAGDAKKAKYHETAAAKHAAAAAEHNRRSTPHMVDTPAGPRESTPGGLKWYGDKPHNPEALAAAREAYGAAKAAGASDIVAHSKATKAAQPHLKGVTGSWDHATHAQALHDAASGNRDAIPGGVGRASAPPGRAKTAFEKHTDVIGKIDAAKLKSPEHFEAAHAKIKALHDHLEAKLGMHPATAHAKKALDRATIARSGGRRQEGVSRDERRDAVAFARDHASDAIMHAKNAIEAAKGHSALQKSEVQMMIRVEAGLLKSQDRVAGPPPRAGVYDGLAAGIVDPTVDRPRWAGKPPQQGFIAVGAVDDSRTPFAFQKPRQTGSVLELAKSAAVEALRTAYRTQLMVAEDSNPLAKLITRGRAAAELPTVPMELRKSVQQAPIDDDVVVEQAAAALAHAARRDPSLRDALSRAGTSRRTLRETYAALGLTPAAVLAGY